jgi:uncharacterized protein YyaL (SSP411 family)
MENEKRGINRLAAESSPYLLQHSGNPVDWYPWCGEAFERAVKEDKPVFLSIGYSACHWCHVMAHESFEDSGTADYLNGNYISIKVDREERPDIDHVYMRAVEAMTGRGGWPLSVFLTPAGKPFFGGTYFPPQNSHGMPGFTYVLRTVKQAYNEKRLDIIQQADELQAMLSAPPGAEKDVIDGAVLLDHACRRLLEEFDNVNGGFGAAPKFPEPMALEFLLRMQARNPSTSDMLELALDRMARGGIYDQVGGGFHRYSTDNVWRIPHFEKMLYDNAQLSSLYLHAFQASGRPQHKRIVCQTLDYLLGEMRSPEGAFYSSQDADSDGVEGKYYVWTRGEFEKVLGRGPAQQVGAYYGVTAEGNFEGSNVLTVAHNAGPLSGGLLDEARGKLREARRQRYGLTRDDKILASWNGLAISCLAESSVAFDRADYLQAAEKCAAFVTSAMCGSGALHHTYRDGRAGSMGYLEDYACVMRGLLDLGAVAPRAGYLDSAVSLADDMLSRFTDGSDGLLYDSAAGDKNIFMRSRNLVDGAVPSGNSAAVDALLRLHAVTGNKTYKGVAEKTLMRMRWQMAGFPRGSANWLLAMDYYLAKQGVKD